MVLARFRPDRSFQTRIRVIGSGRFQPRGGEWRLSSELGLRSKLVLLLLLMHHQASARVRRWDSQGRFRWWNRRRRNGSRVRTRSAVIRRRHSVDVVERRKRLACSLLRNVVQTDGTVALRQMRRLVLVTIWRCGQSGHRSFGDRLQVGRCEWDQRWRTRSSGRRGDVAAA